MTTEGLAAQIRDKALELGYESCGIVRVEDMADYAERLEERIRSFPGSAVYYRAFARHATPQKTYDWAKSIVVCVRRYGKYKVPESTKGLIGKYYLHDYRLQKTAAEYADSSAFETYLEGLGLRVAKELNGVTANRLAAQKAGLGIVRNNNFIYTKSGSWVCIETWLVDAELEWHETPSLPPCPENCNRCIDACPTGALKAPYSMDMKGCISRLTYNSRGLAPEELRGKMGKWVYGCDLCQDVCPMNVGTWDESEDFPELEELAQHISLEKILDMDEAAFVEAIVSKFWYIKRDDLWV